MRRRKNHDFEGKGGNITALRERLERAGATVLFPFVFVFAAIYLNAIQPLLGPRCKAIREWNPK